MDADARPSNLTLAVAERQLVILVRDLMLDYERLNGGPPTVAWLLRQLGER